MEKKKIHTQKFQVKRTVVQLAMLENSNNEDQLEACCISILERIVT